MPESSPIKPEDYVQALTDPDGQCDLGRFTIVNNALRGENEIGEIVGATGTERVVDVVAFSPQRLALLHTAAIVQSEARISNEEHLISAVEHLYSNRVLPIIENFAQTDLPAIQNNIEISVEDSLQRLKSGNLNKSDPVDKLIEKTYQQVQDRIDKGLYAPGKYNRGENIDTVVKKIVSDNLYRDEISKQVVQLAETAINSAIDQAEPITFTHGEENKQQHVETIPLEKLSTHSGAERNTFMIAGPPACGKGSISEMFKADAEKAGIPSNDIVKVNTDFYRGLVSSDQRLGPNKVMHAVLNNDEAAMITDLTVDRLKAKIASGAAPHILLDTVSVKQSKLDIGTQNDGTMKIRVITLTPDKAVDRAIKRGEHIGRFVPVQYMLGAHQKLGGELSAVLQANAGKNIELQVYNNDVPFGQLPALVETVNFKTKAVTIEDKDTFGFIYGRKFINTSTTDPSYIFSQEGPRQDFSQLDSLNQWGYKITYGPNVDIRAPQQKTQESPQQELDVSKIASTLFAPSILVPGGLMAARMLGFNKTEAEKRWENWGKDPLPKGENISPTAHKFMKDKIVPQIPKMIEEIGEKETELIEQKKSLTEEMNRLTNPRNLKESQIERDAVRKKLDVVKDKLEEYNQLSFALNDLDENLDKRIKNKTLSNGAVEKAKAKLQEAKEAITTIEKAKLLGHAHKNTKGKKEGYSR